MQALALTTEIDIVVVRPEHGLVALQSAQPFDFPGQTLPFGHKGTVFPWFRLFIELAPIGKRPIETIVDRDVIPEFTPLVHHFRTWHRQEKRMGHGQSVHRSTQFLSVVATTGIAIKQQVMCDALLIMTLDIAHEIGPIPPPRLPRSPTEITTISQGRFRKARGRLAPQHEPAIGEGRLLDVVTEVFEDQVGPRVRRPDVVGIIEQNVHPPLVV